MLTPIGYSTLLKTARAIAGVVALPLIVYTAWSHRSQLRGGISLLPRLSPGWLLIGVAAEGGSLVTLAMLQRGLLGKARYKVSRRHAVMLTVAANAMTNSLPGGPAWSSTWYWTELRRRRVSGSRAAWSILGSGFFSGAGLALLIALGAEWAGDRGPLASLRYVGLGVAGLAFLLLSALALIPRRFKQRWSTTLGKPWMRAWWEYSLDLHGRKMITPLGRSLANWALDLVLLGACTRALQPQVNWGGLVAAYGLTQLATVFPVTPGGIAVVEGTLAALLTTYGMSARTAVAAAVLYRAVSFWGVTPVGWIAYAALGSRSPAGGVPTCNAAARSCHSPVGVQRTQEAS